MRRLCERPGCVGSAEVSYGIDNANLLVWLDHNHVPDREHAGRLCRRHANALVVPRGWTVDDRRQPVPTLFHEPDPASGPDSSLKGVASSAVRKRGRKKSVATPIDEEPTSASEPTLFEPPTADPDETRAMSWSLSDLGRGELSGDGTSDEESDDDRSGDTSAAIDDDEPVFGRLMGRAFRRPGT